MRKSIRITMEKKPIFQFRLKNGDERKPRLGFVLVDKVEDEIQKRGDKKPEQEKSRPLPKFGEWDVNYPASADGFTVIFAKARDDKKSNGTAATMAAPPPQRNDHPQRQEQKHQYPIEVHFYLQILLNRAALMVV
ncbi:hypothetical protein RHSIM_RhsimUnG0150800 [Rhododendron simsii]|uniref:RIN4 pathogenic type III effector avirulence factor Avr cleavage site domain-containing protein n=1 Tax=Rhododendron simsii TaxID=118357 RepID=A0A834L4J5_RHOSS|nr:hypothetical protein RHSIM_RhsimUnG0150800 [Rhododendron simsii]